MYHLFYTSYYEMRGEEVYVVRETLDEMKEYIKANPDYLGAQGFRGAVLIKGEHVDLKNLMQ